MEGFNGFHQQKYGNMSRGFNLNPGRISWGNSWKLTSGCKTKHNGDTMRYTAPKNLALLGLIVAYYPPTTTDVRANLHHLLLGGASKQTRGGGLNSDKNGGHSVEPKKMLYCFQPTKMSINAGFSGNPIFDFCFRLL
jgi:hypothetical protein